MIRVGLLALALATATLWDGARAQSPAPPPSAAVPAPTAVLAVPGDTVRRISLIEAAKLLVAAGKLDEASKLLAALRKAQPKNGEVLFLLAMVAEARGRYDEAIADFQAILVNEPRNARVRLELARAYFQKHDDARAERQFRLAEAVKLPAAVRANIEAYVAALRARRSWSFSLSVAAAPDSNINAGTDARQIDVYGLPFDLSASTRRNAGVGLAVDAAGEWAPEIGPGLRLRLGGALDTIEYPQHRFDDTTLVAYAGPKFTFARWEISPIVTETARLYGDAPYFSGPGLRLEATATPMARLRLTGAVDRKFLVYDLNSGQTGPVTSVFGEAAYAPGPASLARLSVTVSRQRAHYSAFANTSVLTAAGYSRDLPRGFTVSLEPSLARADYDAPLAAFGRARTDTTTAVTLGLLNRSIAWQGFSPRLGYSWIQNRSDIALYRFTKNRIELRMTRIY
jgi:tetratricopeptide (TPR) repeat protein